MCSGFGKLSGSMIILSVPRVFSDTSIFAITMPGIITFDDVTSLLSGFNARLAHEDEIYLARRYLETIPLRDDKEEYIITPPLIALYGIKKTEGMPYSVPWIHRDYRTGFITEGKIEIHEGFSGWGILFIR